MASDPQVSVIFFFWYYYNIQNQVPTAGLVQDTASHLVSPLHVAPCYPQHRQPLCRALRMHEKQGKRCQLAPTRGGFCSTSPKKKTKHRVGERECEGPEATAAGTASW